jgi:hypothetical protein
MLYVDEIPELGAQDLLKLVARAVGGVFSEGIGSKRIGGVDGHVEGYGPQGIVLPSGVVIQPLDSNLDAFELAALLHLKLDLSQDGFVDAVFDADGPYEALMSVEFEGTGTSARLAATRWAIVQAAAVAGRDKPELLLSLDQQA